MPEKTVGIPFLKVPAIHHTDPGDRPFPMRVENEPGEVYTLCYPTDRATWGNRYALADGRVAYIDMGRIRDDDGKWREMRGECVIGWVHSLHKREPGCWDEIA